MGMTSEQKHWIIHRAKTHVVIADNGCHVWKGVKNPDGYGLIEYRDKISKKRVSLGVHRIFYALINNLELSRQDFICHKCDNPSCVNIEHLFLGNAQINTDDMANKKHRYHHRERKYTEVRINEVKLMLKNGVSMKEVCDKTGLSQSYIWNINWGRVKRDDGVIYPLLIPKLFKEFDTTTKQKRILLTE